MRALEHTGQLMYFVIQRTVTYNFTFSWRGLVELLPSSPLICLFIVVLLKTSRHSSVCCTIHCRQETRIRHVKPQWVPIWSFCIRWGWNNGDREFGHVCSSDWSTLSHSRYATTRPSDGDFRTLWLKSYMMALVHTKWDWLTTVGWLYLLSQTRLTGPPSMEDKK